jgi:murein DD-endopeptidase MepM/ murein hydrolase activator NlpD
MAKIIHDIYIGTFGISQRFGDNPANYAKFGYQGHNGVDWLTPAGTQLVSPVDGKVVKVEFDPTGYGWYVEIWDPSQSLMVIFAHMSSVQVTLGQGVSVGNLVGLSGNTGNSTGPHLHFGVGDTDSGGFRNNLSNGYGGWYDPLDSNRISWVLSNLGAPTTTVLESSKVTVPSKTTTAPPAPTDLSIPNQLELDTTKAMAKFAANTPGVYLKLGAEWIYTNIDIPNLQSTGKPQFSDNIGTQFATLGGYIAVPIDEANFQGFGQDRRLSGESFNGAGGNVSSVRVIAPPPPPPPPPPQVTPSTTVTVPITFTPSDSIFPSWVAAKAPTHRDIFKRITDGINEIIGYLKT